MITIDTVVQAKRQYIIDHVMPSDLDNDVKEGLKLKEEMIANVTAESIRELTPSIDETIQVLNDQGISEEKYSKYLTGEITQIELYEKPNPALFTVKYCIDDEDIKIYKENSIIELKVPETPNEEGVKETSIYLQFILTGELSETYFSKNAYWSILPLDTNPPPVPEVVKIHYKGIVPTENDLIDDEDIAIINNINNTKIYSDAKTLCALLAVEGLIVTEATLKLWISLSFIKPFQIILPNYTVTTKLNDGDFFMCATTQRNHMYYSKKYIQLPKGLSTLNIIDNDTFLTLEKISFTEENAAESQETKDAVAIKFKAGDSGGDCTGGSYCFTDQLQCKKYESVETDIFVYMHVTATKQQEKKQKSCSKSGNCNKSSSSCDKGQADCALQHNPVVNKEWFNNMMDKILHMELDPIISSIETLASSVKTILGTPVSGGAVTDNGFTSIASDADSIVKAVPPRDVAVDAGCSLIMDAAESAMNEAIDSAIGAFNDVIDSTMNAACTSAMNSEAASTALSRNKFKSGSAEIKAISNMNKAALKASVQLMANFSQQICDVRMMDDGSSQALEKIKSAIEVAKQKAQQEAEVQAALVAAQYIKDCQS